MKVFEVMNELSKCEDSGNDIVNAYRYVHFNGVIIGIDYTGEQPYLKVRISVDTLMEINYGGMLFIKQDQSFDVEQVSYRNPKED